MKEQDNALFGNEALLRVMVSTCVLKKEDLKEKGMVELSKERLTEIKQLFMGELEPYMVYDVGLTMADGGECNWKEIARQLFYTLQIRDKEVEQLNVSVNDLTNYVTGKR
jgi:hypothetical protein